MSLEKELVNIVKRIEDEKRLGDKRAEQFYDLIFGSTGTWIPDLQFGQAKVGITYHTQNGVYTKIGNCVFLSCYIRLTSKGSSTGIAEIYGFPFASGAASFACASLRLDGVSYANFPQAYTGTGFSYLILEEVTEAGVRTALTDGNFVDTSRMLVTLVYQV